MITFAELEKSAFAEYGPRLFAILAGNMSHIAPTGNSYEEDWASWSHAFGGAFVNREARKIVLIRDRDTLAGFFCCCIDGDTFQMEEIQFAPEYQGRNGLFRALYTHVTRQLPEGILYVEAYANKENGKSIAILQHLGLHIVGANKSGSCHRFRGAYADLLSWLNRK